MRLAALRASLGAVALIAGQGFLAGATATASTAPPTITADMPAAVPTGHNWSFNDYFPRTSTVRQGSTIDFAIEGFHTATLLPTGTTPAADELSSGILAPDPDDTVANPNGTSHIQVRVPALLPTSFACGSPAAPCIFDGSAVVSSGVPNAPGPFSVQVTADPGVYAFHCRVHAGMVGWLDVVGASDPVPSEAQVQAAVSSQVAADVAAGYLAESLADHQAPHRNADGTKTWTLSAGTSSPDGRTAILEMLPRNVHIRKGDSVKWVSSTPNEPHTVTFPKDLGTDMTALCETDSTDTPAVPNHIPPQGPTDFHCGAIPFPQEIEFAQGNGVMNVTSPTTESDSGIISSAALTTAFGLPPGATLGKWTVSFKGAVAGSYHYVCQIHEGMGGTVTVVPGG